jgi:hypothetical protein
VGDSNITGVAGSKVTGNIPGNASGFTGSLAGDVTGAQGSTVVTKLRGSAISATTPSNGQVLKWNGTEWAPGTDNDLNSGGTVTSVTGSAPITVSNGTTTPTISIAAASAPANGYLSSTDWTTFYN